MARKIKQQICANCEYYFRLGENFCPNCGQENHIPNQPIRHYISELIESIFHLDSKAALTIITIIKYPGKITKEFNENKRARFTPPIRLYVFISFLYFILMQIPAKNDYQSDLPKKQLETIRDTLTNDNIQIADSIKKATHSDSAQIAAKVDTFKDSAYTLNIGNLKFDMKYEDFIKYKNATPDQIDSLIIESDLTPGYFTRSFFRQIIKSFNSNENFSQRLEEKAFKFGSVALFILMPAFAFLLYLLYYKRKKTLL